MKSKYSKIIRYQLVFIVLIILFAVAVIVNINKGSVDISLGKIINIIFRDSTDDMSAYNIVWKIRLPRLLTAAVLGGALSLSGFLLQTFFRNPIAGPFVLGIASGAKMFLSVVTIALAAWVTEIQVSVTVISAFIGSMLSMFFILLFSNRIKSMSMLLVIGIMISYICSAVTDFMINFAKETEIVNLTHWSQGSFSGASWDDLKISVFIVIPALTAVFLLSKPISAYQLGEGYAQSMGVNIKLFRFIIIVLSSILSACVTAFAGPVSFVGIAVPHIARMMLKTSKPQLMIPATFISGAVFCMFCDFAARMMLSPSELSIGTVTGAVGAPIVIWLMLQRKVKQ
jgi:iron complex transport system permease protein